MLDLAVLLLILILSSAFFSGAEVAFLSVSQVKIRSLIKEGKIGAGALQRLRSKPQKMIITILIGNNVANFSAAALVTIIVENMLGSRWIGAGVGILTLIILIFGEIIPKSISTTHSQTIALSLAQPIEILSIALSPIVSLLTKLSTVINKLIKAKSYTALTRMDVKSVIELGLQSHVIEPHEERILLKTLKLHDILASEIMTPKDKIFSLNSNLRVTETHARIENLRYSRIPVYEKNPDNIVGVVNTIDILKSTRIGNENQTLNEIAASPTFVADETKIDSILRFFQRNQSHMIIVINNQKKLVGLITLEDILEEIVGEITDEKELSPGAIVRIDKNTIIAHGQTQISRINRFLNINLPENLKTLSELIRSKTTKIKTGDSFEINGVKITILQIYMHSLRKIRLEKINPSV